MSSKNYYSTRTRTDTVALCPDSSSALNVYRVSAAGDISRQRLIDGLRERGVHAVFHYQPLHLSPMGRTFGGRPGHCPMSERAGDRLVRLPFWNDLPASDQDLVVASVRAVFDAE